MSASNKKISLWDVDADFEFMKKLDAAREKDENYAQWKLNPKLHQDPTKAWEILKVSKKRSVVPVNPVDPSTPQPPGTLRIVMISDTHNLHDDLVVPMGDVLVHAGDFTSTGHQSSVKKFAEFIEKQPHKNKIVIAGNHDLTFEPKTYPVTGKEIGNHKQLYDCAECIKMVTDVSTYLEDSEVVISGIKFYGSPSTPLFFDWAFNEQRGDEISRVWRKIPSDTDFLITHGPPIGHGDYCSSGLRAGCVDLLREIEARVRPLVHVFGHIHEGYGCTTNGTQLMINASSCNSRYQPNQAAIVIDVPIPEGHA